MKLHVMTAAAVMLLGLSPTLTATDVPDQAADCRDIGSLPATLSSPGQYCLRSNRTLRVPVDFSAITITSHNVTLDLNGYTLAGSGAPDSRDIGIYCDGCSHVTIRNGTVKKFDTGIRLGSSLPTRAKNNLIENVRAVRNTRIGIAATGYGVVIRNNYVFETGGSTTGIDVIAILGQGTGFRIMNNDVVTVRQPGGIGRGIDIVTGDLFPQPFDNLAINNRITNADEGIRYLDSDGKYRNNLTSSVTEAYIGGTDAGGND